MLQPDCNSKTPVDLPNIIPLYYCRNFSIFSDFKPKVSVIKTKQNKKGVADTGYKHLLRYRFLFFQIMEVHWKWDCDQALNYLARRYN